MADQMASMLMGGDSDSDDDSNGDVQVVGQGSVAPNPNPVAPLPVAATINPVMQNVASPQVAKSLVPQQRPPPQRAPVPVQQTTQPQRPPMSTPPGVSAPANPAVPMRSNIGVGSSSTNTATSSIAMNNPQQQRRVSASMQTNVIRQQPSSNPSSRHSQPHSSHTPATINPISSNRQPHSGTDTSVGVGQPIPTQRSRQTSSTSVYSQNTHVSASSSARTPTASSLSTPSNTVQQPYSTNTSHIRQSTPAPAPKVPAFDFEPTPIAELKRKSQPQQLQAPVQQQQQASIQQPSRHHPMHSNTNRQTQQHQISQVSRQQHSSSQHPMRTQGSTSTHQPSSSSRSHYQSASSSARATIGNNSIEDVGRKKHSSELTYKIAFYPSRGYDYQYQSHRNQRNTKNDDYNSLVVNSKRNVSAADTNTLNNDYDRNYKDSSRTEEKEVASASIDTHKKETNQKHKKMKKTETQNKKKRKKSKAAPKRPLSAYNIFFKQERQRMLQCLPRVENDSTAKSSSQSSRRRKGRDLPHGKISFENLAKTIGSRWREIDSTERKKVEILAAKDTERYAKEMKVFQEQQMMKASTNDNSSDDSDEKNVLSPSKRKTNDGHVSSSKPKHENSETKSRAAAVYEEGEIEPIPFPFNSVFRPPSPFVCDDINQSWSLKDYSFDSFDPKKAG